MVRMEECLLNKTSLDRKWSEKSEWHVKECLDFEWSVELDRILNGLNAEHVKDVQILNGLNTRQVTYALV